MLDTRRRSPFSCFRVFVLGLKIEEKIDLYLSVNWSSQFDSPGLWCSIPSRECWLGNLSICPGSKGNNQKKGAKKGKKKYCDERIINAYKPCGRKGGGQKTFLARLI